MCYKRSIQISKKDSERSNLKKSKHKKATENSYDKNKTPSKTSRKKGINNSPKTLNISNTENSMQEEPGKNHPAENKTRDEQGIEGNHEKEKTAGSKKDIAQDTADTARNRPNDQQKLTESVRLNSLRVEKGQRE